MYDYNKLLGRAKECGITMEEMASEIGLNPSTLSAKLNNKREFKQSEMLSICILLHIDVESIDEYFFTQKLCKYKENRAEKAV